MWATDERSGSGVSQIEYRLDDDPFHPYTGRIGGPAGVHSVTLRARDRAGHVGTDGTVSLPVDLTAPQVHARSAQPGLWIAPPSGPAQIKLRWAASDDLSDNLRAVVVVHNSTGKVVRRIAESSPRPVLPGGVAREFETLWDGTGDDLLTPLVAGSYYYRVVVADEAGNLAHSTESAPFTVALRGL
jgi:hypothetical protein